MKPMQTLLTFLLAITLLLTGCSGSSQAQSPDPQATPSQETTQPEKTVEPTPSQTKETETEQQASAQGEVHTVLMGSDSGELVYVPETLEIEPGDTVKWVMNKVPPHNVIFEGDRIPNGDKALAKEISHQKLLSSPGAAYKTTFSEDLPSGTYPYYCQPHRAAGMAGDIVIK